MVLQTFKNLSSERQEEILMACYKEFALHGYKNASLSVIIKNLELAKGSFYRYFKSKKELYAFLIKDASNRRLSKLDDLIQNPTIGFFDLVKQNFMDKVQFEINYPVIGAFLFKILHERDNSEVSDLINTMFEMVIKQTQTILQVPRFNAELSISDPTMVAFQIFHTQLWLYDYIAYKNNISYEQNIKKGKAIIDIPLTEVEKVIDNAVVMLQKGIAVG